MTPFQRGYAAFFEGHLFNLRHGYEWCDGWLKAESDNWTRILTPTHEVL